jgi:hypothetical protein
MNKYPHLFRDDEKFADGKTAATDMIYCRDFEEAEHDYASINSENPTEQSNVRLNRWRHLRSRLNENVQISYGACFALICLMMMLYAVVSIVALTTYSQIQKPSHLEHTAESGSTGKPQLEFGNITDFGNITYFGNITDFMLRIGLRAYSYDNIEDDWSHPFSHSHESWLEVDNLRDDCVLLLSPLWKIVTTLRMSAIDLPSKTRR